MDTLLFTLLQQWHHLNKLRQTMWWSMPDYPQIERELSQAAQELREALSPEALELFEQYEDVRNASSALEADASLLCGARVCLRLILTLL